MGLKDRIIRVHRQTGNYFVQLCFFSAKQKIQKNIILKACAAAEANVYVYVWTPRVKLDILYIYTVLTLKVMSSTENV